MRLRLYAYNPHKIISGSIGGSKDWPHQWGSSKERVNVEVKAGRTDGGSGSFEDLDPWTFAGLTFCLFKENRKEQNFRFLSF